MSDPAMESAPPQTQVAAPPRHDREGRAAGERTTPRPVALVAIAGLLVPGMGYGLIGQTRRAAVAGVTVLALFAGGILIGGVRVIDVPGYREGERILLPDGSWALRAQPVQMVLQKPWYMGQVLVGPVALVASHYSIRAADAGYPKPTARLAEIGTLYAAVAGMLNLLLVLDAGSRAGRAR